jgi:hypothetical protein
MRRRLFLSALTAWVVAVPAMALAAWTASGTGTGAAGAVVMPAGGAPTAVASGRDVTVWWPTSTFPDGTPVAGYLLIAPPSVSRVV